jgi:phosphatidate cytidylyltransferase
MKQRIITSIFILLALSVIYIFNSPLLIWAFLGSLYLISVQELLKMHKTKLIFSSFVFANVTWIMFPLLGIEPLLIMFGTLFYSLYAFQSKLIENVDLKILLYPTIGFAYTYMLYIDYGPIYLLLLLLVVSFTDVGAYFVGRSVGKTQFSITSPNKTLEGVFGGIIVSFLVGVFFFNTYIEELDYKIIIAIFLTAVASVFGDLYESKIKRECEVKDSGNLLPGHGGILDRVDGYIFAGPILYTFLSLSS